MIVLGVDSAAKTAGVALLRHQSGQPDSLLYESYLSAVATHSENLLCMVDDALRACRLTAADLGLLAVCAGPGSFTGLRIGMALVKGLAAARGTPCVPVSTLRALAAGCAAEGLVAPAMDARRGEVYTAAFWKTPDGLLRLTDDTACPAATAASAALSAADAYLRGNAADCPAQPAGCPPADPLPLPGPVTLAGDGAALLAAAWPRNGPPLRVPQQQQPPLPPHTAAAAAAIAAARADAGGAVRAGELRPDYHRLCQAERERAEKLAAGRA